MTSKIQKCKQRQKHLTSSRNPQTEVLQTNFGQKNSSLRLNYLRLNRVATIFAHCGRARGAAKPIFSHDIIITVYFHQLSALAISRRSILSAAQNFPILISRGYNKIQPRIMMTFVSFGSEWYTTRFKSAVTN